MCSPPSGFLSWRPAPSSISSLSAGGSSALMNRLDHWPPAPSDGRVAAAVVVESVGRAQK